MAGLVGAAGGLPLALAAASPAAAATTTPVMGAPQVTAADLAGWYESTGKVSKATVPIRELAHDFIEEGNDEGVAGDIAFAQSIVETGYFNFSNRVPPSYNNFSGLGAVDGGTSAAQFPDARTGVRAQIQHLRAYADATVTEAKLAHPLVDPRFNLVSPKGKAPTWEQFGNGIWASDPNYATSVLGVYARIKEWAATYGRWLPFHNPADLVAQGYCDVLFRVGTSAERTTWTDDLDAEEHTPGEFLASLVRNEGAAHSGPVTRLYLAALGRLPDHGGLDYWTDQHRAGVRIRTIAAQFVASSEFARRYGNPSNADFVALLYQNVLGRPGDSGGVAYWTKRLDQKTTTRPDLVVRFSESSENVRKKASTVEATIVYVGMLGYRPNADVLAWWAARRADGAPLDELTTGVLESDAYAARFP
jgi:hypothetical protein